jgi:hypothetical protein
MLLTIIPFAEAAMLKFVQRLASEVKGTLSGFDRVRFRGTKRLLACVRGLAEFLWRQKILHKEFSAFAQETTARLRNSVEGNAEHLGRPVKYLQSTNISKEDTARAIAQNDGVRKGLIAVLGCVEPCLSFAVRGNRATKLLDLRLERMKCLHYYCYFLDAELGLLHARLQTWFPFTVQICLNGREWPAQQLRRAGIGYVQRANSFVDLADCEAAQALMDSQLRTHWPELLERILRASHPTYDQLLPKPDVPYYWSVDESEWATDMMFRSPAALARHMPRFVRHATEVLRSEDILRFLGRRLVAEHVPSCFTGEVVTDLKRRPEGVRVGHRLNRNWIKMYDKQGSVLRVETVINATKDFKVYRPKEGDENGPLDWRPLRKGVSDLHRRAEVSHKANTRYLESLATMTDPKSLGAIAKQLCQPVVDSKGRRVRALNPLAPVDVALLQAVSRGEFLINGFRNRDLRRLLFQAASTPKEQRRHAAAVTRKLRLLREHGVIRKVQNTHRYIVTETGRIALTALEAARQADTAKLLQAA